MRRATLISAAILSAFYCGGIALAQPGVPADSEDASSGSVWLRIGGGTSDNIRRVPVEPESGTFTTFGIESDLAYARPRLTLDFSADIELREYSTAGIDDETYGEGQFSLEVHALPDRIIWVVRDEYSQGRINPFEVTSPENRAEANEFWTGPRFDLPLGQRTLLRLEALKGNRKVVDAERLDSDADLGVLSFLRTIDATTQFALSFSSQGVEYESPPSEIDTETAYLSYQKTLASGEAYLAVGSTSSERGVDSSTTPYIDMSWSRDLGARSRLEVNAVQQYADFFDDPGFGAGGDPLLVRDVYEEQMISVLYSIAGARNGFSLTHTVSRADYTTLAVLNNEDTVSTVSFTRAFTARTDLGVSYSSTQRNYESGDRGDDYAAWYLSLGHELGRRFSIGVAYESHDEEAVLGAKVEENTIRLNLRYALTNASPR